MPVTLLFVDVPRLLDDVLSDVLGASGELVVIRSHSGQDRRGADDPRPRRPGEPEAAGGSDLPAAARAAGADVVVVTREHPGDLARVDPRMADVAGCAVLALAPSGAEAWLHRCRCEVTWIGEVSADSVLAAIRAASPNRPAGAAAAAGPDPSADADPSGSRGEEAADGQR